MSTGGGGSKRRAMTRDLRLCLREPERSVGHGLGLASFGAGGCYFVVHIRWQGCN